MPSTIAHEGGHALLAMLVGLGVKSVTINLNGGGTQPRRTEGFAMVFAALAGYLGPSLFGFAGAWLLIHDFEPRVVLLMSLALMALLLIMVRSFFGLIAMLITGAALWAVAMHAEVGAQLVFAYIWVWFLLMGGVRQIPELYKVWNTGGEPDTSVLAQHTGLSTAFFVALFWLGSMAALIGGGAMMLRHHP